MKYYFIYRETYINFKFDLLCDFVTNEVFTLNALEIQYSLKSIILKFYSENNIDISSDLLLLIINLFNQILVPYNDLNFDLLKKEIRSLNENILEQCVIKYLSEIQGPTTTKEIIEYLNFDPSTYNKSKLLRVLNKNKSIVIRIGNHFQFKNVNDSISGSIIDVVENFLANESEPVHFSVIIEKLENIHFKISKKNIDSNLKQSRHQKFIFFNCGFYGLVNKKYNTYWYNLQPFNFNKFKSIISTNHEITHEKLVEISKNNNWHLKQLEFALITLVK